jgi:hypothetical protein
VSERQNLIDILRRTSAALAAARKVIAASGHLDDLRDIDTLITLAKTEADAKIAAAAQSRHPVRSSDQDDARG